MYRLSKGLMGLTCRLMLMTLPIGKFPSRILDYRCSSLWVFIKGEELGNKLKIVWKNHLNQKLDQIDLALEHNIDKQPKLKDFKKEKEFYSQMEFIKIYLAL